MAEKSFSFLSFHWSITLDQSFLLIAQFDSALLQSDDFSQRVSGKKLSNSTSYFQTAKKFLP